MEWSGITGSSAYDTLACPTRMVLPQLDSVSELADRGNEIHDFCRAVTLNPSRREEFEMAVSEAYRHTVRGLNLGEALDGIKVGGCEVAFALDVKERTCRMIGANINRKYDETLIANGEAPLSRYEIPFTVDIMGWSTVLDCPLELDYKTGASIGDIEEHGQRKIHAAGLMFYNESASALSRVAYIKDDGTIFHDGHEFSLMDAWTTCDELVGAIDAVDSVREIIATGEMPPVNADRDKQCRYCKAFSVCPYWTGLARGVMSSLSEVPRLADLEKLSVETLGHLLDKAKDVLKVYEKLETDLKAFAAKTPLPINDEKEYRTQQNAGRRYFDESAARGMIVTLLSRLGVEGEDAEAEIKKLTKQSAGYTSITKQKRHLQVLQKAS